MDEVPRLGVYVWGGLRERLLAKGFGTNLMPTDQRPVTTNQNRSINLIDGFPHGSFTGCHGSDCLCRSDLGFHNWLRVLGSDCLYRSDLGFHSRLREGSFLTSTYRDTHNLFR